MQRLLIVTHELHNRFPNKGQSLLRWTWRMVQVYRLCVHTQKYDTKALGVNIYIGLHLDSVILQLSVEYPKIYVVTDEFEEKILPASPIRVFYR